MDGGYQRSQIIPSFLNKGCIDSIWLPMAYTSTVLDTGQIDYLLEKFEKKDLKFNWGMADFGRLYRMGFKFCSKCIIMIYLKDSYRCPICGRIMRAKPKHRR